MAGHGPALIVMTEMPSISPQVARFARWVRDAGFTLYVPLLSSTDGAVPDAQEGEAIMRRACMGAEFRVFANKKGANQSSPVTLWLRTLARLAHAQCGGPGIGAVGMCFAGNFALAMVLEPAMLAPVLETSPEALIAVKQRLNKENLTVMACRFEGDKFCKTERFAAYAQALGPRFVARILPDSAANQTGLNSFFE